MGWLRGARPGDDSADRSMLRRLTVMVVAGATCTLVVMLIVLFASITAVAKVDASVLLHERQQVRSALAIASPLDDAAAVRIASMLDIGGVRLAAPGPLARDEVSEPAGADQMFVWRPHRYAAAVFAEVAPIRLLFGTLLVLVAAAIGWQVRRAGRQMESRRVAADSLARTDALTGLGNRLAFDLAIAERLDSFRAGGPPFVLLLADLDGFKAVNDHFGHAAGDEVLRNVAEVLRDLSDPSDVLCRIGGDEFAVLRTAGGSTALDDFLRELGWRLAKLTVEGRPARIGASVGVAESGDFHPLATDLIAAADAALYRAKRKRSGPPRTRDAA